MRRDAYTDRAKQVKRLCPGLPPRPELSTPCTFTLFSSADGILCNSVVDKFTRNAMLISDISLFALLSNAKPTTSLIAEQLTQTVRRKIKATQGVPVASLDRCRERRWKDDIS